METELSAPLLLISACGKQHKATLATTSITQFDLVELHHEYL